MKDFPIRYSSIVLAELSRAVLETEPVTSTDRGSLYHVPRYSLGAVRSKLSFVEYWNFLHSVTVEHQPKAHWVVPVEGQEFQFVVGNLGTLLEVRGDNTFMSGREIVFL